jgi:hypothetical protein
MGQKQEQKPEVKKLHLISLRKAAEQKGRDWLGIISDQNPEAVTCDGFESCVIGVANRFGMSPVVAYDYDKCIEVLTTRDGMTYEEAIEYFEFNVSGAWVGEGTPVFVSTRLE